MARFTVVAFVVLTGFFYITGKPADEAGPVTNTFADFSKPLTGPGQMPNKTGPVSPKGFTPSQSKQKQIGKPESTGLASIVRSMINPDLPIRNPRRQMAGENLQKTTPVLTVRHAPELLLKTNNHTRDEKITGAFGQARNRFTGGHAKPLAVSYQQRNAKTQQPVLGPRLTAILMKRELKRLGCYNGKITSNWNDSIRSALKQFNNSSGDKLSIWAPTVRSLEKLQQFTKTVCHNKPAITNRTILANARAERKNNLQSNKIRLINKSNKWRTSVQHKKASYRPTPTLIVPRYMNTEKPRYVETYKTVPPRVKPRTIARRYKVKRAKRIRITRRKAARRRAAVRSWRRTYRRKRFGFNRSGSSFSLNN